MKASLKFPLILTIVLLSWALMIWAQWSQEFAMSVNLLAMPVMMLATGFVAALFMPNGKLRCFH